MNIAEQLEQNEKYDEAYAEYKKMLAKKQDDVDLLTKLAHLALILDKKEEAKFYYSKILEIDPANILAHEQLIDIYVHEDAIETYDAPMHERQKYTEAAKLLIKQQGIKLVKGKK